jgi:hypothetical protein
LQQNKEENMSLGNKICFPIENELMKTRFCYSDVSKKPSVAPLELPSTLPLNSFDDSSFMLDTQNYPFWISSTILSTENWNLSLFAEYGEIESLLPGKILNREWANIDFPIGDSLSLGFNAGAMHYLDNGMDPFGTMPFVGFEIRFSHDRNDPSYTCTR